jgi:membrane associated rhomboid family serine protease
MYASSMVMKLIIINGLVFLAEVLAGWDASGRNAVSDLLGLHPDTIIRPLYWWQFLTAGFVHAESLNHILFNMLGLYCFGMRIEERYGRQEFLRFYLAAVVLGMVVWSAAHHFFLHEGSNVVCYGASGGVTAVMLLFCLLYPRATILLSFLFPVPAWLVGIIIVAQNLFVRQIGVAYDVHLVGAAFALGYWYFGWNLGRLPGLDRLHSLMKSPQRWARRQPSLKVHDPERSYEDQDEQAEQLLDKVKLEGLDKLTARERRILEDYSRRMRQKLR